MIKVRCKHCKRIYLGERCPCEGQGRYRKLKCDCGKPAAEVWLDDLGEWPLCAVCLHSLEDEPAPGTPLDEREDGNGDGDGQEGDLLPAEYPFGLTRRQYEIALLAHLSSEEIARRLTISENTVNSHMKLIFKKLNVKSRYEIQHVLGSQEGVPAPSGVRVEAGGDDQLVITISISCSGDTEQLRDVLDILLDYTM